MRGFMSFLRKEWQEAIATYRLAILVILFSVFGLMNVFTAKYTPEIITKFISSELADSLPTPTLIDSWLQFFKNIGQVGIIVVVILFSTTLTNEYSKGTLTLLITKGLSRWKIITAKWLMNISLFTLSFFSVILVTWGYSYIYFEKMSINHLVLALFSLWLFVVFLITLINLGSVLFNSSYLVLLFVGGITVVLMLLNLIPDFKEFNPISLGTGNSALIQGDLNVSELLPALYLTIGLVVLIKILTIILFNKKSI